MIAATDFTPLALAKPSTRAKFCKVKSGGISDEALNVYLRKNFNYWRHIPRFFRVWDVAAVEPYSRIDPLGHKLARHRMGAVEPETFLIFGCDVGKHEGPKIACLLRFSPSPCS